MVFNIELTIQNQIVLSYLENANNYSFNCKSNEHKTAKLNFVLTPAMREKTLILNNIITHLKSAHNVDIDETRNRLPLEQIREQYPVVS